jgi:hypothetical protein
MSDRGKHVAKVGRWRIMLRFGRYRWAAEKRPVGTLVIATPLFICTALRRNPGVS